MDYLLPIDDSDNYSLHEFIHVIRRVLTLLAEEAPDDIEIEYPGKEVFFTVEDMIGWINSRVPGEFKLTQEKSRKYSIKYTEKKKVDRKAKKQTNIGLAKTAMHLQYLNGCLPPWAEKPEIKLLIDEIQHDALPTEVQHG